MKLDAADDHRSCRLCGKRVPDEYTTKEDVRAWKDTHLYNNHLDEVDFLGQIELRHKFRGIPQIPDDPV